MKYKYCISSKLYPRQTNSIVFNLQKTVTVVVASADPYSFVAVHLYTDPSSSLISFVRLRVSDVDSLLLFPCLVHVMLGCGLPVALQNRRAPLPSTT